MLHAYEAKQKCPIQNSVRQFCNNSLIFSRYLIPVVKFQTNMFIFLYVVGEKKYSYVTRKVSQARVFCIGISN
jgi:hypothetical protein